MQEVRALDLRGRKGPEQLFEKKSGTGYREQRVEQLPGDTENTSKTPSRKNEAETTLDKFTSPVSSIYYL